MPDTTPSTVTAEPRRFSIRLPHWSWCLLATVLLAVGYIGLSVWLPWHREQPVIQKIENVVGGRVRTEGPKCLRHPAGNDRLKGFKMFDRVIGVDLANTLVTDAELAHLSQFRELRRLSLDETAITDAGLAYLSGLRELRFLNLNRTAMTDAGLVHLEKLSNLIELHLANTAVADGGLAQVGDLTNLEILNLNGTAVTGSGFAQLSKLNKLRKLYLFGIAAKANEIKELKAALPDCEVLP